MFLENKTLVSTMYDTTSLQLPVLIITIGALLLIFLGLSTIFKRFKLSPIIGYILLGWIISSVGKHFNLLSEQMNFVFNLLAKIGVILLLFHIGIESNLKKLLNVIGKAGFVSLCEIFVSGILAFWVSYAFGLSLAASLIIGISMTATSIGVSTYSWSTKLLAEKKEGPFLLDLASFDDIIGIVLLTILFSLLGSGFAKEDALFTQLLFFFLKLSLFIGGCYLFAHFAEKKIMTDLIHYEKMPDSMLSVVGIGLLIAGIAALIEFSLVIGAFFAGIAFSRDPRSAKIDVAMKPLIDLFVPFFFFWIGYQIVVTSLSDAWFFFSILLLAAVIGKIAGVWLPGRFVKIPAMGAFLLSVSMIPRAEVTMVIIEHGLESNWITAREYSAVALIVLATCLIGSIFTRYILKHTQST
jgi:Na+:H+ antiporter